MKKREIGLRIHLLFLPVEMKNPQLLRLFNFYLIYIPYVLHLRPTEPRCHYWSRRRTLGVRFLPPLRMGPTTTYRPSLSLSLSRSGCPPSPALSILLILLILDTVLNNTDFPRTPPTPPRRPLTRPRLSGSRCRFRCPLTRLKSTRRRSAIAAPNIPLPWPRPPSTFASGSFTLYSRGGRSCVLEPFV